MQTSGGMVTEEIALRQALAGSASCGVGFETAQRQALGEGAKGNSGDVGDGTEAIVERGSATAQKQALGEAVRVEGFGF